jgi:hypothetical protein
MSTIKHCNLYFKSIVKISDLRRRLFVVVADKRYDNEEENHILVIERFSIITPSYGNVSILKMRRIFRKKR